LTSVAKVLRIAWLAARSQSLLLGSTAFRP
jgi:hypothetical protein